MHQSTRKSLRTFLDANPVDLTRMTLGEFQTWLEQRLEEAERRPLFQARLQLRDLKRQHRVRLRNREVRLQVAEREYREDPVSQQFEELSNELWDLGKAVEGLTKAVAENRADPEKLASFLTRLETASTQREELLANSLTRQRLEQARESLEEFHREIGLLELEDQILQLGASRGNVSTHSGGTFEETASEISHQLLAETPAPSSKFEQGSIHILHSLTLGCARGEFDQMVVRAAEVTEPVEVLAMVEVKRNINDLVHGFRLRQENLAWLVGDESGYTEELYRTKDFPQGKFTGAVHQEQDRGFRFTPESFRRLATKEAHGHRLVGLWFITETRPLLGVTSAELERILYRISTDPGLNISHRSGLGKFRKWVLSIIEPVQTRDVLELYAESDDLARQIVFSG